MRFIPLAGLIVAQVAAAQVSVVGDIVVVQDPTGAITNLVANVGPGALLPSPQEQFCRAAYNQLRTVLPDEYDGVISFTTSEALTDLNNVWQGSSVRADGTGYGRQTASWANTYNGQKISHCVFMGALGRTTSFFGGPGAEALPADPDAAWSPSLGIQIPGISSLSGIEMLGHEYGHHWLLGVEFDQSDGRGRQSFIRAYNAGNPEGGQDGWPNQHYSRHADSRSVMYGECITDLGGGSFRLEGCQRKYSHIDQYLMGLRAPSEVTPMMVLEDPADLGKGVDAIAMSATSSGTTLNNQLRHDITADEIISAMGARIPGYPNARNCWRVAFVVVLAPGQTTVPPAMLQKVQRYQARWGPWFSFATGGRGVMDARVAGTGCLANPPDAGVVVDAGQPVVDAGQPPVDAGVPDAGVETPDAGEPPDAGVDELTDSGVVQPVPDAGPSKWETQVPIETAKIRPGCGCGATGGLEVLALLGLVAVVGRSRRRAA